MIIDKNGKIRLTLTEDHYKQISSQIIEITDFHKEFGETIITPLTLEFEVPNLWRTDIENAPRDRTPILAQFIYTTDNQVWVEIIEHKCGGWMCGDTDLIDYQITHWMEIPELPKL